MAVYVDDMRAPFRQMLMCHMVADTHEELVEMADQIGVARRWLQSSGNHGEHFDVCCSKRARAVKAGAIEISWAALGEMTHARRGDVARAKYFTRRPPAPAEPGQRGLFEGER